MNKKIPGSKVAEQLWGRPGGATMSEVISATGSAQYNRLKALKSRGFAVRKIKEGDETRYFVTPPANDGFEATLTAQGQVTVPKEIRDHFGLRGGQKLRFQLGKEGQIIIVTPADQSVRDLFGVLGTPPRRATLADLDAAVGEAAVSRYRQSGR